MIILSSGQASSVNNHGIADHIYGDVGICSVSSQILGDNFGEDFSKKIIQLKIPSLFFLFKI